MKDIFYNTPPYLINGQHRITINLIGAGGTGSLILTRLARLHKALNHLNHPGLFVNVFDDDKVELFNVGRQMFSIYDVGFYKSSVLIERINQSFGLDWRAYHNKYLPKDAFNNKRLNESYFANIFISAVDNINTRIELKTLFDKLHNYQYRIEQIYQPYLWLDCGNSRTSGQFILSTISKDENNIIMKDVIELFGNLKQFDSEKIQGVSCSYKESLDEQDLFINDAIALYSCDLLWKLFRDKRINYQGGFLNTGDLKLNAIKLK